MWIETMKSGIIYAREKYTDPLTGKRKTVSVQIRKDSAKERKRAMSELTAKIEELTNEFTEKDLLLKTLIEKHIDDARIDTKIATVRSYESWGKCLLSALGNVRVQALNAPFVRKAINSMPKSVKWKNNVLRHLKRVMKWGYRNDLVEDIRWIDKLVSFKDDLPEKDVSEKYLEKEELEAVIAQIGTEYERLVAQFLVLTGLRIGEAIALSMDDVDLQNKTITVSKSYDRINKVLHDTPKTKDSNRTIYIQNELLPVCQRLRVLTLERKLFASSKQNTFLMNLEGGFYYYHSITYALNDSGSNILGRPLYPHILRHTHASLLAEQGIDIKTIMRRLGHSDSEVTESIYTHVTQKVHKRDSEAIAAVSFFS